MVHYQELLDHEQEQKTKKEIEDVIGIPCDDVPCVSAKNGTNIDSVLREVVKSFPSQDRLSCMGYLPAGCWD